MQAEERAKERREAEISRAANRAGEKKETERIRSEERNLAEQLRKEDLQRMEQERHAQQKAHEIQLELLKTQMAAMAVQKFGDTGAKGHSCEQ